jgi:hypothetical protein
MSTATSTPERVYYRDLPGGGFVAIDVNLDARWLRRRRYRGALIAERRAPPRAAAAAPVLAEATGNSVDAVVQQLFPAAQSNLAIGAAFLRRQRRMRNEALASS